MKDKKAKISNAEQSLSALLFLPLISGELAGIRAAFYAICHIL